ncbi:MAG: DUF350 domain-containing protein [Candidatus Micrarchaeia archaeon]
MGLETMAGGLVIGFLQLVLGLVVAMFSIYMGMRLFDRVTKGINEMKELKKGNVAVGILLGAVIISIANVVQSGVSAVTGSITAGMGAGALVVALGIGILNLLIGLAAAVVSIYLAMSILDKITVELDEWKEIAKGNVAVAIMMAAVLFAVSFVVQAGVSGISRALDARALAAMIGVM